MGQITVQSAFDSLSMALCHPIWFWTERAYTLEVLSNKIGEPEHAENSENPVCLPDLPRCDYGAGFVG